MYVQMLKMLDTNTYKIEDAAHKQRAGICMYLCYYKQKK